MIALNYADYVVDHRCNGGVNMVLDWDKKGYYRFAPLQSDAGKQLLVRWGTLPGRLVCQQLTTVGPLQQAGSVEALCVVLHSSLIRIVVI